MIVMVGISHAQFFKPLGKPLGLLMLQDGAPDQWIGSDVGCLADIHGDGKSDSAGGRWNANARYGPCYIYFGGVWVLDGKADIALHRRGDKILSGDFNGYGRRDIVTCGRRYDTTIQEWVVVTRYYEQNALPPFIDSLRTREFAEIRATTLPIRWNDSKKFRNAHASMVQTNVSSFG